LTGAAPATNISIFVGTGSLNVQGQTPNAGQTVVVAPGSAALTLVGAAPNRTTGRVAFPGSGSLTIATGTPQVFQTTVITPGTANLVIVTFAPRRNSPNWVVINDTQDPNWIPIAA
jgi:hypothetical protein